MSYPTCAGCGARIEPSEWVGVQDRGPDDTPGVSLGMKRAPCCRTCFDAMDTDVWTCRAAWEALNPVVPYGELPDLPKDGNEATFSL